MSESQKIEALQQIIEEQKIAISQISHEIRNPVTVINSSLKLIEKQHPEVQNFAFWEDTMRDMGYLLKLLDEVSSYNNSTLLHTEMINTSQWLTEFLSSLANTVPDPFRFSFQIAPALPPLSADPLKLRRALENLIRNGFEALEDKGEVSFSASSDGKELCLRISDTGCGIPESYLDTLYQPFVTHKPDGTGLGLSITRRIIEAHGGAIKLDTAPHQGTVFTILLPLSPDAALCEASGTEELPEEIP